MIEIATFEITVKDDDPWFVPGAKIDVADSVRMRLRPPRTWLRVVVEVRRRPKSMNSSVGRGHWTAFRNEKKAWQDEIATELMVAKVSRRGYQRALAGAFVRFDQKPSRPPDPGNYATVINKALGDALVEYGAIPDDDDAHYAFGGVEFEEEIKAPARTVIVLYLQPKEG